MIAKAEKIAAGAMPMRKARFLKVSGARKELDQATIDRARQLAMRESAAAFARNHLSPDNTFAPLIEIIKQACGLSTELNP